MKIPTTFVRLRADGNGSENLPLACCDRKLFVKDVVYGKNYCFLTVKSADEQKIFAISRNMCYNVERIGYKGGFSLFKKIALKAGACLGAAAFTAFAALSDSVVSEIVYKSDAAGFRREILAALKAEGVEEGRVCRADCSSLGEKLALGIDGAAYATVEKVGRRVIVDLKREAEKNLPLNVAGDVIRADAGGTVVAIKVFSGRALVKIGDAVEIGDALIVGEYEHADKIVKTYALGEVALESTYVYEYLAASKGDAYENRAVALGKAFCKDLQLLRHSVTEESVDGGKTLYKVTFVYLHIIG